MRLKQHDLALISESLKAMAHPDRINILTLLSPKGGIRVSVSQICDKLNLNQPEVSRHLSILKNKGLLQFERVGSHVYYSINTDNLVFSCVEKLLENR